MLGTRSTGPFVCMHLHKAEGRRDFGHGSGYDSVEGSVQVPWTAKNNRMNRINEAKIKRDFQMASQPAAVRNAAQRTGTSAEDRKQCCTAESHSIE